MLKLIKLEWEKNYILKYICKALILAVLINVLIFSLAYLGIANDPETGVPDTAEGFESSMASITELLTSMSFLVFTGTMLANFIVKAYKNKTMNLMFSYPIKRQKILASQMIAVWIFSFTALTLTKLLIYISIFLGSRFMTASFQLGFDMTLPSFYIRLLIQSVVIVSMSFIALFVGLMMKSSKTTVITSFLLIFLTQGNIGDLTLSNSAAVPLVLILLSLVFAVLSVRNAETKDLM